MVRVTTLLLLCLTFCFAPQLVLAQMQPSFDSDTVYFTSKRKKMVVPFKLVHNLIIIPVRINNSTELNFILDSGVKNTLITRLNFTDSLELHHSNRITIRGLGEGHNIEAVYSEGNSLSMDGIEGQNQAVYVLMEDVFNLSTRMGMPVHGIIGYDIFKNFIVKINYNSKTLTLYRPDYQIKKAKRAEEYFISIEDTKPYLHGTIKQHNGDSIKVKLVVDTGASHSLSLYLPTDERFALPPKVMDAYLGRGLSGDINGKIGRLNAFRLGKYELENLTVSYPDTGAIKLALDIANRNGNLGSDILKRFTVIFDYPHKRMLLLPNSKFKEPFQYNMAGFDVSTPLPGTNFYLISNVVDNSPAEEVGLQAGDQLLHINGRDCKDLKLQELLELLESRPGRKLKLKVNRNGETHFMSLILQSRI